MTDFDYYKDADGAVPEWFPVTLELSVSAKDFADGQWAPHSAPPPGWRNWIRIPSVYRRPPLGLEGQQFCTAIVRQKFFQQLLINSSLRRTVRRFELCMPLNISSDEIVIDDPQPLQGNVPDAVVVGIIDDGLAFAHRELRLPDGTTRVENYWDQNAPVAWAPGLGYGREWHKRRPAPPADLVTEMANATRLGLVDEDQVYRATDQLDFRRHSHKSLGRRVAHGTHVMHLACAIDPGVAPDARPVVCVQFPSRAVEDTSGASAARHIVDGLVYIIKRADAIAVSRKSRVLPIVVNTSFGNIAGPHDGSSMMERAIDRIVRLRNVQAPLAVVLPSGNSHLARCHAIHRFRQPGDQRTFRWRIQPDDLTPSHLQLWPHRGSRAGVPPQLEVRITDPSGNQSPWIAEDTAWRWRPGADVICAVIYLSAVTTGHRSSVRIWVAPTATWQTNRDIAASGVWRVDARRVSTGREFRVHAWIQRDDRPMGYPIRGRQSYFDDANYERFDPESGREFETDSPQSYVNRDGSMNAFATGRETVVIGGFRASDLRMWKHSAGGPTLGRRSSSPTLFGPDAVAVSEESPAFRGRLAAGSRSGSVTAMNGTSIAAPQVARWIANQMEFANRIGFPMLPGNGRDLVEAFALGEEAALPPTVPQLPRKRAGAGRIRRLRPVVNRRSEP